MIYWVMPELEIGTSSFSIVSCCVGFPYDDDRYWNQFVDVSWPSHIFQEIIVWDTYLGWSYSHVLLAHSCGCSPSQGPCPDSHVLLAMFLYSLHLARLRSDIAFYQEALSKREDSIADLRQAMSWAIAKSWMSNFFRPSIESILLSRVWVCRAKKRFLIIA